MNSTKPFVSLFIGASLSVTPSVLPQGSLTPPGAPNPTMRALDQIASTGIAINQTNTPGNASALFVISSPGSYFVTGNYAGVSGKSLILVNSNNVTIDLNGFALLGTGGTLAAITDGGNSHGSLSIKNGSIIFWGGAGISVGSYADSVFANLIVTDNGGVGMSLGDAAVARDCVARNNNGDNIVTGYNATLQNCIAVGSVTGNGINLGPNSTLANCAANFNKLAGITTSNNCSVQNSAAGQNFGTGIVMGNDSLIRGCTAALNAQGGINCFPRCTLVNCVANGNSGFYAGISAAGFSTLTGCSASNNNAPFGIEVGAGGSVIQCNASGNTSASSLSGGIQTSSGCTVKDCTTSDNLTTNGTPSSATGMGILSVLSLVENCTSVSNQGDAIRVGSGCVVRGNLTTNTTIGAGIHATASDNRIEGNLALNNDVGIRVDLTVNLVFGNTARGNSPNFSIVAGNRVATIITPATNAAISGSTGGTAFSTDASSNIAY